MHCKVKVSKLDTEGRRGELRMKGRIEEVLSRILSEKYDAKVKIKFKEIENEQRRDNHRVNRAGTNARKRDQKVEEKDNTNQTIHRSL